MSDPHIGPVFASFDDVTIRLTPVSWISWDMPCWTPKPSGAIEQNARLPAAPRLTAVDGLAHRTGWS